MAKFSRSTIPLAVKIIEKRKDLCMKKHLSHYRMKEWDEKEP